MNRELYLCSLLMLAVFAGMIWYLADYVSSNQEALFNNSYNSQQRVLAQENTRGTIYAGTGEVLAQTVIAEDGTSFREYPYKNIFAHVVGYTDKGKTGIEELENYQLIHSDISDREKLDHELAGEKNPGNDVYTTLDTSLQQAASDALGLYRGAIVVTEVKTGRVLAMVSKPDYDPNKIAENWETLSTDKDKAALVNRGTQGLYPPGSTFKIVTALAYIRQNPDSWQNYHYQCNGAYINGDNKINCYHGSVHGSVDLMTSFAKSCNASFANIGMSMDREKFGDTIDSLLFNQELSFPLPYNQTKVTLDKDSTDEDVIQTSIGQGKTQITPVQLNLITAAIANGGKLMQPIVVDGLFQLALAAAALAHQRVHRRRKVAAKEGIQPFPHTPHVVGALGDGRSVGIAVAILAAFHPTLFFQPVKKVQNGRRCPALCAQLCVDVPSGDGRTAGPHGKHDLLLCRRKRLYTVRDAVHPAVLPPFDIFFAFTFVFVL